MADHFTASYTAHDAARLSVAYRSPADAARDVRAAVPTPGTTIFVLASTREDAQTDPAGLAESITRLRRKDLVITSDGWLLQWTGSAFADVVKVEGDPGVHVGPAPPADTNKIWVDTGGL